MLWLPIPGFSQYEASSDGLVRNKETGLIRKSYAGTGKGKDLLRRRIDLMLSPGVRKKLVLARVILSAKLGRPLQPYEQARHIDGDPSNDCMQNLSVGCAINNVIDNVARGTFSTSVEQIDIAIERLTDLKHVLQTRNAQEN
jgi:hypothetical protein